MNILLKSLPNKTKTLTNVRLSHYGGFSSDSWITGPIIGGAVSDAGGAFARKGESEENVYFYNLQREQLAKLKAAREKSDWKVKYEIVKPSQLPKVQELMYESGYPREPMVNHLGLCKGLYSIPDSDKLMENIVLTYNMSILAIDKVTLAPVGVAINGEFNISDVHVADNVIRGLTSPDFGPIIAIRDQVDTMGSVVFREFNTDTIFNTKYLTVKQEMAHQGLATGLLSRAIQQASALGYKGIKTVVSHNNFKKAAMDNGMELVAEVKFDEFTYRGKKVFEGLKEHHSCAFMAKQL